MDEPLINPDSVPVWVAVTSLGGIRMYQRKPRWDDELEWTGPLLIGHDLCKSTFRRIFGSLPAAGDCYRCELSLMPVALEEESRATSVA